MQITIALNVSFGAVEYLTQDTCDGRIDTFNHFVAFTANHSNKLA